MNRLNFEITEGFRFDETTLKEMQDAWTICNAFGAIAGEKAIIKGCEQVGSNVTDGFVYINGELLPFKGGAVQTTVIVMEDVETMQTQNNPNPVPWLYKRYATFGLGVNALNWADFKRVFPTTEIARQFDLLQNYINTGLATKASQSGLSAAEQDIANLRNQKEDKNTVAALLARVVALENKPKEILAKGSVYVGNLGASDGINNYVTVTIPNQSNANYSVFVCPETALIGINSDEFSQFVVKDKTTTSFKIFYKESMPVTQQITFHYLIV